MKVSARSLTYCAMAAAASAHVVKSDWTEWPSKESCIIAASSPGPTLDCIKTMTGSDDPWHSFQRLSTTGSYEAACKLRQNLLSAVVSCSPCFSETDCSTLLETQPNYKLGDWGLHQMAEAFPDYVGEPCGKTIEGICGGTGDGSSCPVSAQLIEDDWPSSIVTCISLSRDGDTYECIKRTTGVNSPFVEDLSGTGSYEAACKLRQNLLSAVVSCSPCFSETDCSTLLEINYGFAMSDFFLHNLADAFPDYAGETCDKTIAGVCSRNGDDCGSASAQALAAVFFATSFAVLQVQVQL